MPANSSSTVVNLDFDVYKQDLINFLKSQSQFKDYDFTGSNINVLMDLLSFNTNKLAFFLNMGISEGFLDSAQLLNTVRSHAKDLNYTPRSSSSAKANITVTFNALGTNQPYIIQKGSTFSSIIKNNSVIFSVPETITCASANTTFSFTTDIFEGIYVKDSYVFVSSDTNPRPKFAITNPLADTNSITVTVFEDNSVVGSTYKLATSLLDITNTSKVFFIQCSAITGNYEILFGDNNLGYQPKESSTVVIDYRVCNETKGNGAGIFTINFDPTGSANELVGTATIITNQNAVGGAPAESIETTRFYAPRFFQTQERCVTANDYKIALKTQFPEINAVNAYGGEKMSPPQFGKVAIAIDITGVNGIPTSKLFDYFTFIKGRCPLTIVPIFLPADHTFICVESAVNYNINVTSESKQRIETLVVNAINVYNDTFLDDFNTTFRYSKFINAIDNADQSIISNNTKVLAYKKTIPLINTNQNITLNFGLPLVSDLGQLQFVHPIQNEKCVTSTNFTYNGQLSTLEDDGNGVMRIVQLKGSNYSTATIIGLVDYTKGIVLLQQFKIDSYEGDSIKIYVRPLDNDINVTQSNILSIESSGINLTINAVSQ